MWFRKSPEQVAAVTPLVTRIFQLAADGRTYEAIASELDLHVSRVGKIIRRELWPEVVIDPDIATKARNGRATRQYEWTDARLKAAAALIERGKRHREIVATMNREFIGDMPLTLNILQRTITLGKLPHAKAYFAEITARHEKAFELLRQGKTPLEIDRLGVLSRGQIYRILWRFDGPVVRYARRKKPEAMQAKPKTVLRIGPQWACAEIKEAAFPHAPSYGPGVSFDELDLMPWGDGSVCKCRHWIGDPAATPTLFCGRPSQIGRPYCEEHVMLAYRVGTAKPLNDARREELKGIAKKFLAWRKRRGQPELREAA